MKKFGRKAGMALAVLFATGVGACTDLTTEPRSTVSSGTVFTDADSYEAFLAKVYAGLALSGQQGPAGEPDIEGSDEGFGQYVRGYWQLQELPTDEAVIGWGDPGLPDMVTGNWGSANIFVTAAYYRIFFQIAMANEFLRQTSDAALGLRGHTGIAEIPQYRAEARALRALSYWHGLDLFRNIPLVTEDFVVGNLPEQVTPTELFDYIESELLAIRDELPAVGDAQYGRLDQGFVAMLLAKLYLNAEVYGVGDHSAQAMTEAQIVASSTAYELDDEYQHLFLADNHTSPEIVFAVPFDGLRTQTWGGTTFLTHAALGGSMNAPDYGVADPWGGLRVTQQFVALFEGGADGPDDRSDILYTSGQDSIVGSLSSFNEGYAFPKYQNVTSLGVDGSHATHTDNDFPMFRLADAMLMYAEACLRSGGGACEATALGYVNEIRERAYGNTSGNISAAELTLDFILDERARELSWEAHRRTDLIRFGLYTGGEYVWAFKGGAVEGAALPQFREIYPIPANELIANPNLDQNPEY